MAKKRKFYNIILFKLRHRKEVRRANSFDEIGEINEKYNRLINYAELRNLEYMRNSPFMQDLEQHLGGYPYESTH